MGIEQLPDPYTGFDHSNYSLDLYGWGSDAPVFRRLIEAVRPSLIIEVGTWKGASAIHMAGICKELGLNTKILCIDTWLGAIEMWTDKTDETRYKALDIRNGWPHLYYQFIANVVKTGHDDCIVPFPISSLSAARWLQRYGVTADLIYIDASHDTHDVYWDIQHYLPILNRGGVMFGDDYDWGSVRQAVDQALPHKSLEGRTWITGRA